VRYTSAKNFY